MASKTVNYTPEQTQELVTAYVAAANDDARAEVVATFAEKFGRKVQSIRQKLVRENVYVKKERTTKDGGPIENKEAIVADIAEAMGVDAEVMESLTKANKTVLMALRAALTE